MTEDELDEEALRYAQWKILEAIYDERRYRLDILAPEVTTM